MRTKFLQIVVRLIFSLFWVGIIFVFLLSPVLSKWWRAPNTINVLVWADMLDPQIFRQFEVETGIAVYPTYFESNEELFVKLKSLGDAHSYDLIMVTDYMVQQLIEHELLQPIDKTKLTMWHRLDNRLLGLPFDPKNQYSIPYHWAIYGLGVATDFFAPQVPQPTWGLIFDPALVRHHTVAMPNVAREAVLIAVQYLFGDVDQLDQKKIKAVSHLLLKQKKWIEAYTDFRANNLLVTNTCPVVVTNTSSIWRNMRLDETIAFLVPREGSFFIIDALAIPRTSTKKDYAHRFINFIFRPEVIRHHFELGTFFPATYDLPYLFEEFQVDHAVVKAHQLNLSDLTYFKNVVPETTLSNIWIRLKGQ